MATIIQYTDSTNSCIKRYVETSLDYVRMVEHKLTEVLEKMKDSDEK